MAHQLQKNTVQMENYLEAFMPQYETKSFKSFIPQRKSQSYFSPIDQNIWEDKNRISQKVRNHNNYDENASRKLLQQNLSQGLEAKQKDNELQSQLVQKFKQESSDRLINRQKETVSVLNNHKIHSQYLSNQLLSEDQQTKLKYSITDHRPTKTGSMSRIINKSPDCRWNHLETNGKKQLDNYFTKKVVDEEIETFHQIKKRVLQDEDHKTQRKLLVAKNRLSIQASFKQQQLENQSVINKLKVKQTKIYIVDHDDQNKNFNKELFKRLSLPKEQYRPENTGELPEFRDLITSKLGKIDEIKNPYLLSLFEKSQSVKKNIRLQSGRVFNSKQKSEPFEGESSITKSIQKQIGGHNYKDQNFSALPLDTVDQVNQKNLELNEAQVIWEINDFEKRLKMNNPIEYFSQIKQKEFAYLQNLDGYKSLQTIKKSPENYVNKIGNQIREEQKVKK